MTAALRLLAGRGPGELTVRRIAEEAGSSTMGIYTRFGGRTGVLDAAYERGFEALRDALAGVPTGADVGADLVGLARACRGFALANPALYAFMFERPVPGFDPDPQARQAGHEMTFGLVVGVVRRGMDERLLPAGDPMRTAHLFWCVVHGTISLELTRSARTPMPARFIDSAEEGEAVLVDGVRATLAGLSTAGNPRSSSIRTPIAS